ncbi:MAG TPA: shikimate dehydrogenase [Syntrophales bacterium]|nr:shikimate dehydrogenase [Syntrophales bacterium]
MICIPITGRTEDEALLQIEESGGRAHVLELRVDLIAGDLKVLVEKCRSLSLPVQILVTNRKEELQARENFSGEEKRITVLKEAIRLGVDYVDVELDTPDILRKDMIALAGAHGGRTRVIISHHDYEGTPSFETLRSIFHECMESGASVAKIVTFAKSAEDCITVCRLIPYARRRGKDIIAFCMGDEGRKSRIMAALLGTQLSFASLTHGLASAPGQLTVDEMEEFMIPGRKGKTSGAGPELFCLFGNPVQQSLSPLMHEAALRNMNIAGKYLPFRIEDIGPSVNAMREIGIRGASITVPFKVDVMEYLDYVDHDALEIGAVNTVVNDDGRLTGFNTDWIGLVRSVREFTDIKGRAVMILGAGGAARAAVFGILREGGIPIVVNRNIARGERLAARWGCHFHRFEEIATVKADGLINTTPVGMMPDMDKIPVDGTVLANFRWVMDCVYNPLSTRLISAAGNAGCVAIPGIGMFVHQGAEQIRLWTRREAPRELMKKVVKETLLHGN